MVRPWWQNAQNVAFFCCKVEFVDRNWALELVGGLSVYILWPAFSCGYGEKREQRPHHVIIVELMSLPLPLLHLLPVPPVIDVVASEHTQGQWCDSYTPVFECIILVFSSDTKSSMNVHIHVLRVHIRIYVHGVRAVYTVNRCIYRYYDALNWFKLCWILHSDWSEGADSFSITAALTAATFVSFLWLQHPQGPFKANVSHKQIENFYSHR